MVYLAFVKQSIPYLLYNFYSLFKFEVLIEIPQILFFPLGMSFRAKCEFFFRFLASLEMTTTNQRFKKIEDRVS